MIRKLSTVAGKSKRASALVATVERATEIFIERGQIIAYENPEITQEMLAAVEEVRKAGELYISVIFHVSSIYKISSRLEPITPSKET